MSDLGWTNHFAGEEVANKGKGAEDEIAALRAQVDALTQELESETKWAKQYHDAWDAERTARERAESVLRDARWAFAAWKVLADNGDGHAYESEVDALLALWEKHPSAKPDIVVKIDAALASTPAGEGED